MLEGEAVILQLGDINFDKETGLLTDSDSNEVSLRPQSHSVLKVLASNDGRLVGRDDLMKAVWQDIAVTDDSLVQCISDIRRAIGAEGHKIIQTIPKHGYKLVAPTKRRNVSVFKVRYAIFAACFLVIASLAFHFVVRPSSLVEETEISIAVMPFDDLSADSSQAYFADGIADDIITDLIKISGIKVIARQTSFQFRDIGETVKEVGEELGVKFILQGTVRRANERLRINAQLVEIHTGNHVWADRYDGSLDDIFTLQDKITRQIIGAFEISVANDELNRISARGTNSTDAYDAFLRGRKLLAERKLRDFDKYISATKLFKKALEFDPNYAEAIAGLAWVDWLYKQSTSVGSGDADFQLARRSILIRDNAQARRLLAKEHFSLQTWYRQTTKNTDEAVRELERAHVLAPNDPDVIADLATALSFSGDPHRGVNLALHAQELNPNHSDWYYAASGIAFLLSDKPVRAMSHLRLWSEANPDWYLPLMFLAAARANAGDPETAKATLQRSFQQRHFEIFTPAVAHGWPMRKPQENLFLNGLRLAGMRDKFE